MGTEGKMSERLRRAQSEGRVRVSTELEIRKVSLLGRTGRGWRTPDLDRQIGRGVGGKWTTGQGSDVGLRDIFINYFLIVSNYLGTVKDSPLSVSYPYPHSTKLCP